MELFLVLEDKATADGGMEPWYCVTNITDELSQ